MKKRLQKLMTLAIGSLLAVSILAACTGEPEVPEVNAADISYRICYDNLSAGYVKDYDTQVAIQNAKELRAVGTDGKTTELSSVASYDEATGVFKAVGAGTVYFKVGKTTGKVEVVPAYVTNPNNQYTGNYTFDMTEGGSAGLLGRGHDPSLIEVEENGKTVYYIFSTGWDDAKSIDGFRTYGNMIHRSEDLIKWEFMGRTFDYDTRDEDFVENEAGLWLYGDGTYQTPGYNSDKASWWAPDIVPAAGGGYWLYTCVVDGAGENEGMAISGAFYARACCLLYHSDSLEAGSFKYVGVLMQSSIKRHESEKDVNGIDPQIIYDTDGKMYMAYGSFGSGNYVIELDPTTGLRKDGKGWQTHEQIRNYVENDIQDLYKDTKNPNADNKAIGWTHEYYGTNISKQNMEAPVIARHDNVKIFDETATFDADGNPTGVDGKTYYYTMHSYNGLSDDYQMWGGRSESPLGVYKSVNGGIVYNVGSGDKGNEGNKYMGAFQWSNKT
ncbi:MAG: family 43 glycosylhydrolase, partial [Clostridiales bacterium]|nr:family 43 glycosylhydrolase [Clostridiales bacterium]